MARSSHHKPTRGAHGRSKARIAPWTDFEQAVLEGSVKRRLFTADRAMIVLCDVTQAAFPKLRINRLHEVTAVLRGSVEIRLGEETILLHAGEAVDIPAQTPHALRCLDGEPAEVLNILSPPPL